MRTRQGAKRGPASMPSPDGSFHGGDVAEDSRRPVAGPRRALPEYAAETQTRQPQNLLSASGRHTTGGVRVRSTTCRNHSVETLVQSRVISIKPRERL